jgi:uncharacterized protein (TIGR03437 family)
VCESMKTKTTLLVVLLLGACAWQSSAQPAFDSSGDKQLNGAYYLRQVFYFVSDEAGDLGEAMNVQGEITFNGSGTYTFTGTILDSAASTFPTPQAFTGSGTYVISASGEGYISAVNPDFPNDQIIGLVSHSVFIGSSTENGNGYNDLFIAAPIGSVATNATLNGSYSVAYFDPTFPGDALFTMSANGSGTIGTVNVKGYTSTNTSVSTETLTGVTYNFANGGAQINFGGSSSSLIFGTEVLYITPDGNFIFGGSANGFDMFAGVRGATSNPSNYDSLYYQAGLDLDEGTVSQGYTLLDSYYGSFQAFSQNIIGDQRVNSILEYGGSSDFTYYDTYALSGNGQSTDTTFLQDYVSSTDGTIRIGYGLGPYLALNIAFQGPALSGSGVYLSPVGVVNAASSAPFTAFVSPGEFLTLYGSGLAPTTNSASVPFPKNLSGVQVLINQVQAPIYFVSPTQISVIVPYDTVPASVAQIQVINNGANSNVVTLFTGMTSVGVFTNTPVGGIGIAAALRPDYSVISEANPAQIGETEALYLAGMGAVSPAVGDGTAAPGSPLSNTTNTPYVYIYDSAGNAGTPTITYSGLAPGFAGLYQINFTIPTGLVSGDADLEVAGPDSDTLEAYLPLTTTTSAAIPADRSNLQTQRPSLTHLHRHRLPASEVRFSAHPQSATPLRDRGAASQP